MDKLEAQNLIGGLENLKRIKTEIYAQGTEAAVNADISSYDKQIADAQKIIDTVGDKP